MVDIFDDSFEEDEVSRLEGEIIDLKYELRLSKDRELIFKDLLSEVDNALNQIFEQEKEIERFRLDEKIDYRECLVNLKKSFQECRRVYRVNF
jgi:hypothetical protein